MDILLWLGGCLVFIICAVSISIQISRLVSAVEKIQIMYGMDLLANNPEPDSSKKESE